MKRNPETGETATQPLPAQTADLSISGLRFIHFPTLYIVLTVWSLEPK